MGKATTETRHRLLHYKPIDEDKGQRSTCLASPFVEERVAAQVMSLGISERQQIKDWMRGVEKAASLRGWIFEAETHQALCEGCSLQLRPLTPAADLVELVDLTETDDPTVEFEEVSFTMAARGPYHKPKAKNFESIDSFYLPNVVPAKPDQNVTEQRVVDWNKRPGNRLLLFQITVSGTHSVNAGGLIHVLNYLGLLKSVVEDPQRAALVFVVPRDKVKRIQRQTITEVKIKPTGRLQTIRGIGDKMAAELENDMQIKNVGDLQAKMLLSVTQLGITSKTRKASWARICELGLKHGLKIPSKNYGNVVARIPQYVCTWEKRPWMWPRRYAASRR